MDNQVNPDVKLVIDTEATLQAKEALLNMQKNFLEFTQEYLSEPIYELSNRYICHAISQKLINKFEFDIHNIVRIKLNELYPLWFQDFYDNYFLKVNLDIPKNNPSTINISFDIDRNGGTIIFKEVPTKEEYNGQDNQENLYH